MEASDNLGAIVFMMHHGMAMQTWWASGYGFNKGLTIQSLGPTWKSDIQKKVFGLCA